MTQMLTPEVTLAKALEFLKTNDEDNTMIIINDFILYSKKKYWTQNHEQLILILIELSIKKNKLRLLKDGLNYYRGISQNYNIDSLAHILTKTKELVEDKFLKAQKSLKGIKIDIQDLESEDSPELLFLYSFDDGTDTREKEDLINSQKFIWETYKILLDLTKTNSKLLSLYAQILKSAFNFCKENKRKVEFKRLCDSVRGYLQTLIKTEKKQFFQNKVQISRPEVLKILIQIRISLLDTATELEQWQEAFKTAEDIIYLMDKYEKQTAEETGAKGRLDGKAKRLTKIPPIMKLEFYFNIEKLLWISDYHLYHAHATILIKELATKALKWLKGAKTQEKQKEGKSKLEKYDLENVNNRIILGALVTPFKNTYTNYVNIGDELFEYEKEMDTQTCSRMMGILKLNAVPSRKNLINFLESNAILEDASVDENIRLLFNLLQNETNPLIIGKKGQEIVNFLRNNPKYEKYSASIEKNLTIRCLMLMTKHYDSIPFRRLLKILPWSTRENMEDIIAESTRIRLIQCTIDHSKDMIKFKNSVNVLNSFNEKLTNFLNSVEKISTTILATDENNKQRFSHIRQILFHEIHSHNTNSLFIYDALISSMDKTTSKLTVYLKDKREYKEKLRESAVTKRKEEKEKAEEDAKAMREILKDEQKKKEFETQLKKYLIDRIRIYANVLHIDGKKVKLDDLLKDLSKITDEQLIHLLEKEEYEFKTKKEKRFKQIAMDTDYMIREFRKRDFDATMKTLVEEETSYNQSQEEEWKKSYNEKIGMKGNLLKIKNYKENYYNNILTEREIVYNQKMIEFTQSLEKKIKEDLYKDIGPFFKAYVDDFRKKEEEAAAKSNWKPQSTFNPFMKKGEKFVSQDRNRSTFTTGPTEFKKGSNVAPITTEPRTERILEFKKGEKFTTEPVLTKPEFTKGTTTLTQPEKKEIGFKRSEKAETTPTTTQPARVEFHRGSNIQPKEKENVPDKIDITSTAKINIDGGFKRGVNLVKEEPKKTEPVKEEIKKEFKKVEEPTKSIGFTRKTEEHVKSTGFTRKTEETAKPSTTTAAKKVEEPAKSTGFARKAEEPTKSTGFGRKIEEPAKTSTTTKKPEETAKTSTTTKKPEETAKTSTTTKKPEETAKTSTTTKKPEETAKTSTTTKKPEETAKPSTTTKKPEETAKTSTTTKKPEETKSSDGWKRGNK